MDKQLVIVAGHGKKNFFMKDPGATMFDGKSERSYNIMICKRMRDFHNHPGIHYVGVDEDLTINQKVKKVNAICEKFGKDNVTMISIHMNSAGRTARGTEAWHHDNKDSKESKDLGNSIIKNISSVGLKLRKTKNEKLNRHKILGEIHNTLCTSVLIEVAFGSSASDLEIVNNNLLQICSNIFTGYMNECGSFLSDADIKHDIRKLKGIYATTESLECKNTFKRELAAIRATVHKIAEELRKLK